MSGAGGVGLIALIQASLGRGDASISRLAWAFVGLCGVALLTRIVSQALLIRLSQGTVFRLHEQLSRQILATPLRTLEEIGSPRLLASLTDDVLGIANALAGLPVLGINVVIVVCCLVYLGWLSLTARGTDSAGRSRRTRSAGRTASDSPETRVATSSVGGPWRRLLGRYLGRPAGEVRFSYKPEGKPYLAAGAGMEDLRFNVAHADGLALVAVAQGREIGVDLEKMRAVECRRSPNTTFPRTRPPCCVGCPPAFSWTPSSAAGRARRRTSRRRARVCPWVWTSSTCRWRRKSRRRSWRTAATRPSAALVAG